MDKKIRVLFFNYEYPPLGGGAANATRYIFQEFAKRNDIEISLITSGVGKEYSRETLGENIVIHKLPIGKNPQKLHYQSQKELIIYFWKAFWFSRQLLKKESFDLSHSFFSVPCGLLSWWLKKIKKIPYVVSLRGADVPGYSERFAFIYKILTPIIKLIWQEAHFVVSNSQGLKDLANQSAPKQAIDIIYNGIDVNEFFPRSDWEKATQNIITVSRLTKRKGIEYLISAISEVKKSFPGVKLFLAGDGDYRESLSGLVSHLELEETVIFLGLVPHEELPAQVYQKADLFVLPSLNEGMSNTMLEALASGLPLIATPTGGSEELIEEGKNGFIVPMKDPSALAEKIKFIFEQEKERIRMGINSRKKAEELSWQKVMEKYLELYRKIS